MHDDTLSPQDQSAAPAEAATPRKASGARSVPAVAFGLGTAALAGVIAVASTAPAAEGAATAASGQAAHTVAHAQFFGPHTTCSGEK
ncbi:MAG TPA: hypothetical protein VGM53_14210 [Streptosporangiaceae bacterium]